MKEKEEIGKHSIKVPRLYKIAAKIAAEVEDGGNLKSAIASAKHPNKKGLMALLSKTFEYKSVLEKVFRATALFHVEPGMNPHLAVILTTELFWGNKRLESNCKPIKIIKSYRGKFEKCLKELEESAELFPQSAKSDRGNAWKPRYIRINTIKISIEEATKELAKDYWVEIPLPDNAEDLKGNLLGKRYSRVDFMEEVFVFPEKTTFSDHPFYKSGKIFLQDKASCMVIYALNPTPGSTILDMCAAPGMKTTHLAAYIKNEGLIYAIERDQARYKMLRNNVRSSGASCIQTFRMDAFQASEKKFPNVRYICLDVPCSGSGTRPSAQTTASADRLSKLSNLQRKLLRHALTKFPGVERVVYSTCSIHREENEDVVAEAVATIPGYRLADCGGKFPKCSTSAAPYSFSNKCLLLDPYADLTNGFFIAVFERT